MKLLSTINLLKEIMKLHSLCEDIRNTDLSFQAEHYMDKFYLPTGFSAQICIGYSTAIRIYSSTNHVNLLDCTHEAPYNDLLNMLWEDNFFRYNYNSPLHPCIYRMGKNKLRMSADTFPAISTILPEEEDVIEPILFQKMTQYSTNEVQSMILESILRLERGKYYFYNSGEKKYGLSYGIDYGVLDIISKDDIDSIIQEVKIIHEELTRYTIS